MKLHRRIISLLSSAALLVSVMPSYTVHAEDTENPDLLELAFSLGAATDYLNIANYWIDAASELPEESYQWYYENSYNYDLPDIRHNFNDVLAGGMCLGISLVEVLAHNGTISPSDLAEDAEYLCDIELTDYVNNVIASYQAIQDRFEQEYYIHYNAANYTREEQIDMLIETAEKNMEENRYFLITYNSTKAGHAVAGIGIADGNWEFEGNTYDKCILTLDSNSVSEDGVPLPFYEGSNIYINSGTRQFFIPSYADYERLNEWDTMVISAVDDDAILNYRGFVSPTLEVSGAIKDAVFLSLSYIGILTHYKVTMTDSDGNVYYYEDPTSPFGRMLSGYFFVHGKEFHIETDNVPLTGAHRSRLFIKNSEFLMDIFIMGDNVVYDISRKKTTITAPYKDNVYYEYIIDMNEGYYDFTPYYSWYIDGYFDDTINFEIVENGILVSSDKMFTSVFDVTPITHYTEGAGYPYPLKLNVAESVLITVDESGVLVPYIDPDKDGVYDTPVQKGDVNCDGRIDSVDASIILKANAELADEYGEDTYLSNIYADMNGDGRIDTIDAAIILAMNADNG